MRLLYHHSGKEDSGGTKRGAIRGAPIPPAPFTRVQLLGLQRLGFRRFVIASREEAQRHKSYPWPSSSRASHPAPRKLPRRRQTRRGRTEECMGQMKGGKHTTLNYNPFTCHFQRTVPSASSFTAAKSGPPLLVVTQCWPA